jgi:hypothetical protein
LLKNIDTLLVSSGFAVLNDVLTSRGRRTRTNKHLSVRCGLRSFAYGNQGKQRAAYVGLLCCATTVVVRNRDVS